MSLGEFYILGHFVRHGGRGTFFEVFTRDGERLLIKLVPEQDPEAEQQFATWLRSRSLRHPHLLDIRDVGRSELTGKNYIYAVFEFPDDILSSAVEQGPLSESETRSVQEAVLAGLHYLHGAGLFHGAVVPDHIVAVGDTIKLATDALREADDPEEQAEDLRQLSKLASSLGASEALCEPPATRVEPPAAVTVPAPPAHRVDMDARSPGTFPKWIFAGLAIVVLFILNCIHLPLSQ